MLGLLRSQRLRRVAKAIAIVTLGCASATAQKTAASVSEALANLHRSQAKAADWEGFQAGSSVTYRQVGKNPIAGEFNETVTQVLTARSPTDLSFEMVLADGERNPWLPAATEFSEYEAANGTKTGEEDITIGKKRFHTEIYLFQYSISGREFTEKYWLAAGVPNGVAQSQEEVRIDPTYTSHTEMKVTDLDVSLKAGTKTVHGYCFELVEGLRGGRFSRGRVCKSKEVPGAVVTEEAIEFEGTKENKRMLQTVESFKAVR
jgi:hypothetical protein